MEELRIALRNIEVEEAKRYSGHSFRSRAATTAAVNGIEDHQIKLLGRWKSTAYQRYIQPTGTQLAKLATRLSSGGRTTQGCTDDLYL